ncbi:MAG TPA: S9 family peptidase [Solirubrobacteraceae bacterium]
MASPYGSWRSALSTDVLLAGEVRLGAPAFAGDARVWSERRPAEGGRSVLVRRESSGARRDILPAGFDVRTRVHEYGGGAWLALGDAAVVFSNDADGRLYRQDAGGEPYPITPEPPTPRALRYADLSARGDLLVCVRETHGGGEAVNELVTLPAHGGDVRIVATGHDFFAAPRPSPGGERLAWLTWEHPRMPWDGTELWVDGERVAGGPEESIVCPAWSPDGALHFVSDRTGWWNLYRLDPDGPRALTDLEAELGEPLWAFGLQTYAFLDDGSIACAVAEGGRTWLGRLAPGGDLQRVDAERSPFWTLASDGRRVAYSGAGPTKGQAIVVVDLERGDEEVIATAAERDLDPAWISVPREIAFPAGDGASAHALFYPPANPDATAPEGERPPLLVLSHGGPTGRTTDALDVEIQFWTSRGFAVVDVNYGGSTGYGRAYRERLDGAWGIVDVADCVAAARHLSEAGEADGARIAIRGSSAGGYTTLRALTATDAFAAGASHYGVADLEALARDTHKFESRYLDRLVGPYPAAADVYRERSPIHHVDDLSCPVILLQGLEDPVVPPAQAEAMAAALDRKGIPYAYLAFPGEQHGFRKAETIRRAAEAELAFYGRIFGFEPADELPPLDLHGSTSSS